MDYQVGCADSGSAGINMMKAEDFDVILVDLRMRRMDGNQFLHIAKTMNPDCKVVMMSAYATPEAMVTAIREQAFDYLLKPFRIAELQRVLHSASRDIRSRKRRDGR